MKSRRLRLTALLVLSALGGAGALAATGLGQSTSEPLVANRYTISVDGYTLGTFSRLLGVSSEVETAEYWESDGSTVTKLPGKFKPPTITLKRNATRANLEIWSWYEAVRTGTVAAARRSATLTMYDSTGKPVVKYWLEKAWPSKVELTGVKAGAGDTLQETVTFTAEYLQRLAP